jgi:cardiolipin synthase (CMP-forming)
LGMGVMQELRSIPNMLSILRLFMVPVFLVLLLTGQFIAALITLMVASATDWLDGQIARRFNQITKLGQLLDPAADRLFIFAALIGLTINASAFPG